MKIDTNIYNTIPKLFRFRVQQSGSKIAFWNKEYGIWKSYTWNEYYRMARMSGLALISLGLKKQDKIAILSQNRPEWIYADIGCSCIGGVTAGIYPTSSVVELEYIVNHSEARVLFVEDEEQLDKALECLNSTAGLHRIVLYDQKGLEDFEHPMVLKFDEFVRLGEMEAKNNGDLFEQKIEDTDPDDVAVLVYTSGTTGPPKGAMLSHRNIIWTMENFSQTNPFSPKDEHLSCFPLCHSLERFWTVYHPNYHEYTVHFPENFDAIQKHLFEVQPTIMFAVPRYWEKFYSTIQTKIDDALKIEKWAYNKALKVGSEVAKLRLNSEPVPLGLGLLFRLLDWFIFRNIKKMLGLSRARLVFSGGAPISAELLFFFHSLGLWIRECYGSTEASAVSGHQGEDITPGTVGKLFNLVSVKIAEDGEIMIKGPNIFMGYLKEPELTAETIVNGWYHSGDVGEIDENGDLKITDRKKDIIITAGGKNITPSEIENQLKFSHYINDSVVIGDGRKYLTALIMIDEENVMKYAQDNRIPFTTYASLTENPEIIKLIQNEVDKVNNGLARVETIKQFRLLSIQLTPEDEEVTPTLKLKRKYVNKTFKDLIESMY